MMVCVRVQFENGKTFQHHSKRVMNEKKAFHPNFIAKKIRQEMFKLALYLHTILWKYITHTLHLLHHKIGSLYSMRIFKCLKFYVYACADKLDFIWIFTVVDLVHIQFASVYTFYIPCINEPLPKNHFNSARLAIFKIHTWIYTQAQAFSMFVFMNGSFPKIHRQFCG